MRTDSHESHRLGWRGVAILFTCMTVAAGCNESPGGHSQHDAAEDFQKLACEEAKRWGFDYIRGAYFKCMLPDNVEDPRIALPWTSNTFGPPTSLGWLYESNGTNVEYEVFVPDGLVSGTIKRFVTRKFTQPGFNRRTGSGLTPCVQFSATTPSPPERLCTQIYAYWATFPVELDEWPGQWFTMDVEVNAAAGSVKKVTAKSGLNTAQRVDPTDASDAVYTARTGEMVAASSPPSMRTQQQPWNFTAFTGRFQIMSLVSTIVSFDGPPSFVPFNRPYNCYEQDEGSYGALSDINSFACGG